MLCVLGPLARWVPAPSLELIPRRPGGGVRGSWESLLFDYLGQQANVFPLP